MLTGTAPKVSPMSVPGFDPITQEHGALRSLHCGQKRGAVINHKFLNGQVRMGSHTPGT